jgi:hypothetical protein
MSSQLKKNTSTSTRKACQAERKFCKVCYDAGKSSTAYSSHYVRDSIGGKVICPTILSQECNYCKQVGHTPSYCPALKYKKNKTPLQNRAARLCESPPPAPMPIKQMPTPLQIRTARLCESPPPMAVKPTPLQHRAARLCESPPPPAENYFKPITVNQPRRWETIIKPKEAAQQQAAQQPEAQTQAAQEPEAQEPEAQTQAAHQPKAPTEYIPKDYSNCSWGDI